MDVETTEQDTPSNSPKKSVSWGPKHIKRTLLEINHVAFDKNSVICSTEEAQSSPVIKQQAPKVLKSFEKQKILLYTQGSRKSARKAH
jgi:hypothetical protein